MGAVVVEDARRAGGRGRGGPKRLATSDNGKAWKYLTDTY